MNKRLHIFVSGIVQGVFFRQSTTIKAEELDLKGWVKNLRDGRVEIVCEGKKHSLDKMLQWCRKGPDAAFVDDVDVRWEEFVGDFNGFQTLY
jgi:acylphosphatase